MDSEPTVQTTATARVSAPFTRADLARFLDAVPPEAELSVTTHMGGDQRDPYPIGYTLVGRW